MDSASDTAKLSKLDCLQVGYGIFLPGYYSVMLSNYQENTMGISAPHCSQLWPPLGKEIQLALGG